MARALFDTPGHRAGHPSAGPAWTHRRHAGPAISHMHSMSTKGSRQGLQPRQKHKGVSLVELLIGVLIGLLVGAGAIGLFLSSLESSRRLLLEARMHQDLRTAADLVTRDLRRAGHWNASVQGITGNASNPNGQISSTSDTITYRLDTPSATSQQAVWSLSDGKIRLKLGTGSHQDVTDPHVMTITEFAIAPRSNTVDLGHLCASPCTGANCPRMVVRRFDIALSARSATDPRITRQLQTSVRVRNDEMSGTCPS